MYAALKINIEIVFPALIIDGPGFYLGQINALFRENIQHLRKRAARMGQRKINAHLIRVLSRLKARRYYYKAGVIVLIEINAAGQHVQAVLLGRAQAGYGRFGRVACLRHIACADRRIIIRYLDVYKRQTIPYSALMMFPEDALLPAFLSCLCSASVISAVQNTSRASSFNAYLSGALAVFTSSYLPVQLSGNGQFYPDDISCRTAFTTSSNNTRPVFTNSQINADDGTCNCPR